MKYKFNTDIDVIDEMLSTCYTAVRVDADTHRVTMVIAHLPGADALQVQMEVTSDQDRHVQLHDVGEVIGNIDDEGGIHMDEDILEQQIQEMLEYMYSKSGSGLTSYMIAVLDDDKVQVHLKIKRGDLIPAMVSAPMQIE